MFFFSNKNHYFQSFAGNREEEEEESDSEGWEEREASRTHSVKFSEDSGTDKDTPFVRQNTPHPKDLKAKAHRLFAKEKSKLEESANLDTLSEEVSSLAMCYLMHFGCYQE